MSVAFESATVGQIVADDFRAAAVFDRFGIDFCCDGRQSLPDACRKAAVSPDVVVRQLEALDAAGHIDDDVARLPLDRLIDHIVSVHHVYVREALPRITGYLRKLVEVHGGRHAELALVAAAFDRLGSELKQHLIKEERVLFPHLRDLAEHGEGYCARVMSPFGSVENPIRMMEREHRDAGDELEMIRELTSNYTAPADGCTTYAVCMRELKTFERDLHRHVHLENNVLFPRAIALENGSGA
jgi:regulator of cell morphogenesis and NO signaling